MTEEPDTDDDGYVPMQGYRRRVPGRVEPVAVVAAEPEPEPVVSDAASLAVWGVVAVPFAHGLVNIIVTVLDFSRQGLVLNAILFLVVLAAGIFCADADRTHLARAGVDDSPSPFWALVPIIWIVLRTRVVARHSWISWTHVGVHVVGLIWFRASFFVANVLLNLRGAQEAAELLVG